MLIHILQVAFLIEKLHVIPARWNFERRRGTASGKTKNSIPSWRVAEPQEDTFLKYATYCCAVPRVPTDHFVKPLPHCMITPGVGA
jgi:hypothetical protein